MNSFTSLSTVIAQTGDVVNDPANERVVRLIVAGLVVLGVLVLAVTVWFWRSTRPEPEALAPLEAMSRRDFLRLPDDEARRAFLEAARQRGDEPLPEPLLPAPSVPSEDHTVPIDPLLHPRPPVP